MLIIRILQLNNPFVYNYELEFTDTLSSLKYVLTHVPDRINLLDTKSKINDLLRRHSTSHKFAIQYHT